ncbi:Fe-S cluster assembly protein SufD [Prosthecobacter fusiformis]|uniref:Fe-S cluster assembly protein SufD n=1 Tax=Prosthecobacter fusiformis TaxID=48464 RepID=A0A4R7RMG0_9BACT|nr:Fe-S cluster assembly protein SufD [Prosthecobacter fusiformis]TDU66149.1 Fe-S cluster assembly protein SufD [Prosthecobacter fusiformis]
MPATLSPTPKLNLDPVSDTPAIPAPSGLEVIAPVRDETSAPGWFLARSEAAWEEFQKLPTPSIKDENWRYSNAKNMELAQHRPAMPATEAQKQAAILASEGLKERTARFVFVNDELVLSETDALPVGVVCVNFAEALKSHGDVLKDHFMKREMTLGSAKFAALHLAHVKAGTVIVLPKNVAIEKPIEVFHWVVGDHAAIFPHTLIVSGDNAEVSVVDHYRSLEGEGGLSIAVADLVSGTGSRITYAACQELADDAQALHLSSIVAGRDANVKSFQVQLGAAFSRSETVSDLIGQGSRSDMLSVSLPIGDQIVDQRTLQNHMAPHATSDLLYKNALYGKSRSIFSGLITVDETAHYTDAYQTCRNLLNSDEAEATSLPGLEINADQVKCSHGATSGPISDEELFYLKARGISDSESRKLIIEGFLADVLKRFGNSEVLDTLVARIDEKLERAV